MRSINVPVDEETLERLDTERRLLGFDDRASYVRWLIDNRGSDAGDDEDAEPVDAYADRVERLARRAEDRDEDDDEGVIYVGGEVDDVQRVPDDTVTETAADLGGVDEARLDDVARRAVARTRDRLGRSVGTGLSYTSSNERASGDTPPGSDITDLASLSVPGRDAETRERRRRAVGAALALLRDRGSARRGTFVSELFEEYPAGYDSESGWWRCVKAGLQQVDAVDGAGPDSRTWEFDDRATTVRTFSS